MTKSTITREQLLEIIETDHVQCGEASQLARMALAAMDSEPVAVVEPSDYVTAAQLVGEGPARKAVHELYEGALRIGDKLYRHAQQPVLPKEWTIADAVKFCLESGRQDAGSAMDAWSVCRAAMLQAQSDDDGEPTDDERIMAIEGIHNCERCSDEGWVVGEMGITRCACNQGNPVFKIDLNSDFIKHVKAVSEKVRAGNSPAIPDGYVMAPKEPTEAMIAAAMNCEDVLFNSDDSFCVQFGNIYEAMLAAAQQEVKGE